MSHAISYIGIDVGHRSFSAAVPGQRPRDFSHDRSGVQQLLRWAARSQGESCELRAVCESSGPYSRRFALLSQGEGVACAIVPPQRVRANARALGRLSKTDRIDAEVILDYAVHVKPPVWQSPPPEQQQLSALLSAREDLQTELRRWGNRLHALQQLPDSPPALLELHKRLIAGLAAEHKALERPVKELIRANADLKQDYRLLLSIPGVGPEIACAALARRDIIRTRSEKELTAYAGLAPLHRQSGTSLRGKSHIGHCGDKRLRTLLYMGALSAAQWNPPLKEHYLRLRSRGMEKTPAHTAVARKLLLQIRSVLRSGQPFVPYRNSRRQAEG